MNGVTTEEVIWLVPEEVLTELRGLKFGGKIKIKEKNAITVALEIITKLNPQVVKMSDKNTDVDTKIVNYLKDKDIILATLDKQLQSRVKNKILTIRGKKGLEII
jgi:rRNA-processing protein FCF1